MKEFGGITYMHPIGGKEIFKKDYFESFGIKLEFLEPTLISYHQFNYDLFPRLSIIDVLIFISLEDKLSNFRLT